MIAAFDAGAGSINNLHIVLGAFLWAKLQRILCHFRI
jgi:hypothetical protein